MFTKRALKIDSANEDANELWIRIKIIYFILFSLICYNFFEY